MTRRRYRGSREKRLIPNPECLLTPKLPGFCTEAGVARGKLNTTVLGFAIGMPLDQASTGPCASECRTAPKEPGCVASWPQRLKGYANRAERRPLEAPRGAHTDELSHQQSEIQGSSVNHETLRRSRRAALLDRNAYTFSLNLHLAVVPLT